MSVMDILIRATDQASSVIEGVSSSAGEASSFMEANWGKVALATGAAGAALEGFARGQADTNAIVARASIVTGENEDAIRDTISSLQSWNFSGADVARGMEELIRRGVTTKEGFEDLLPVMDNFSDATGRDVVESIRIMDATLNALGIPLEEAGDHVDTFTFLSERTTIPLEAMERMLGRVGPALGEMDVGLDQTAAFLTALEAKGFSGREALREFSEAAEKSGGDVNVLKELLGLTDEELAIYQEQVAGAAGMTTEFANVNNETMTPLERLQAALGNTLTRFGGLASAASSAGPALMGVAAVMPALTAAKTAATFATRGLSVAMGFLAANPIVLVIAAVAALVAAVIFLWNNNEAFRNFILQAWEVIKNAAGAFLDKWRTVFNAVGELVSVVWNSVLSPIWERVKEGIVAIGSAIDTFREKWATAWGAIRDAVRGPVNGIIGFINGAISGIEGLINKVAGAINAIPSFKIPDWVPIVGGNNFSLPNIDTVSLGRIPSLQMGGIVPAVTGGLLALLGEGGRSERIQPLGGVDDPMTEMVRLLREISDKLDRAMKLSVDGRELANAIGGPLMSELRTATGM